MNSNLQYLSRWIEGSPLQEPDFVSEWLYIESTPLNGRQNVNHNLGEMPMYVQVQVTSNTTNNSGYIFPAIGKICYSPGKYFCSQGLVPIFSKKWSRCIFWALCSWPGSYHLSIVIVFHQVSSHPSSGVLIKSHIHIHRISFNGIKSHLSLLPFSSLINFNVLC